MPSTAHPVCRRRTRLLEIVAVLVGGALGTALRVAVDATLPHDTAQFALSTVLVNTVGAFVLGLLVATLWPRVPGWARAGLGAGVLGSFTTFSALAVAVVALAEVGDVLVAVATVVASLVLGLLAAWAGLAAGGRRARAASGRYEIDEVTE
jgi:CrcB protein